jgi:hypothetical protein
MLPRRSWKDIKLDLKETGWKVGNWIHLATIRHNDGAFLNTEMNLP